LNSYPTCPEKTWEPILELQFSIKFCVGYNHEQSKNFEIDLTFQFTPFFQFKLFRTAWFHQWTIFAGKRTAYVDHQRCVHDKSRFSMCLSMFILQRQYCHHQPLQHIYR